MMFILKLWLLCGLLNIGILLWYGFTKLRLRMAWTFVPVAIAVIVLGPIFTLSAAIKNYTR